MVKPAIERKLVDPAALVEARPIYLGVNVVGGHDPCPDRFMLVRGENGDKCTTHGLDRTLEHQRKLADADRVRRAILAASRPNQEPDDDGARAIEMTVRKAERAIASAQFRHPEYLEQMGWVLAISVKDGGGWSAAAQRLQNAYKSTLSADEIKRREKNSVAPSKIGWRRTGHEPAL
jgi:hypothetical protein